MATKRILCLTPNPAIDRTLVVPGLRLGQVARAREAVASCGGKGVNVARAARLLGLEPLLAGPLGGMAGRLAAELAAAEGLAAHWTSIGGATRTCVILVDPETRESTVVNEPGPALMGAEWKRVIADALAAAADADAIAVCGSMPAGLGPDEARALIAALAATEKPLWVDTSGPALAAALDCRPSGVKVNAEEAAAALDARGTSTATLARLLLQRGAASAIVTDGPRAAAWAAVDGLWQATPPPVVAQNATGCGDAFLAGVLASVTRDWPPPQSLRYATAVGAAAALGLTASRFKRDDLDRLLSLVTLS